jgi:inner membrane protein
MDNLCHTLVGATLAEAGGRRFTPLATATLIIGANLPDVDIAALAWGPAAAVAWRRGVTHGVLALALLPPLLAVAVLAWDRRVRLRRRPDARPASPLALLGLAAVAVLTHPLLDWLNEYGMRWWMPWSGAWAYGDALFIADVWVWLALALGVLAAWRRRRRGGAHPERPARVALALVAAYIVLNLAATAAGRTAAREGFQRAGIQTGRLMVAPVPLLPFRRRVVADAGDRYVRGTIDWLRRPVFAAEPGDLPKAGWVGGAGDGGPTGEPAVAGVPAADAATDAAAAATAQAAARTVDGARFLSWARFPFYRVEWLPAPVRGARDPREAGNASGTHRGGSPGGGGGAVVWLIDARYASAPGARFGALAVRVSDARQPPAAGRR